MSNTDAGDGIHHGTPHGNDASSSVDLKDVKYPVTKPCLESKSQEKSRSEAFKAISNSHSSQSVQSVPSQSSLPRVWSSTSISSLNRRNEDIFEITENEAPSTASSLAASLADDLEEAGEQIIHRECSTPDALMHGTIGTETHHFHALHGSKHYSNRSLDTGTAPIGKTCDDPSDDLSDDLSPDPLAIPIAKYVAIPQSQHGHVPILTLPSLPTCTETPFGKPTMDSAKSTPSPDTAPFSVLNHLSDRGGGGTLESMDETPDDDHGNGVIGDDADSVETMESVDSVDKWLTKGNDTLLSDTELNSGLVSMGSGNGMNGINGITNRREQALGDQSVLKAHSQRTKEVHSVENLSSLFLTPFPDPSPLERALSTTSPTNKENIADIQPVDSLDGVDCVHVHGVQSTARISDLSVTTNVSSPSVSMYKEDDAHIAMHDEAHLSKVADSDGELLNETNENDECSSASSQSQHFGLIQSMQSIVSSPRFMDSAVAMYSHLDDTLSNINELRQQQLEQMRTFRRRRKRQRRRKRLNTSGHSAGTTTGPGIVVTLNGDENGDGQSEEKKEDSVDIDVDPVHLNEHLAGIMQTLITSTTEMGSLLRPTHSADGMDGMNSSTDCGHSGNKAHSFSSSTTSMIGGLLGKLSSSIAYISYVSFTALTPILYNMVEAVLLELYATIKDVIECYDPDPKNNILWRIIHKMNEIIEAMQGLMALSDCFYEIQSDSAHESDPDTDHGGGSGGSGCGNGRKLKTL